MSHIPVLLQEVLQYFDPQPNQDYIDATSGAGGHSLAILEKTKPNGRVLSLDLDERLISKLLLKIKGTELEKRLITVCVNFSEIDQIAKENGFEKVDGILFDLGLNSESLEESGKGFSFLKDEPLDMRFGKEGLTASEIVNTYSLEALTDLIRNYSQEKYAYSIAQAITKFRQRKPIVTTFDLIDIIKHSTPLNYEHRRIHPATRTFQALRIATNNELQILEQAIPKALSLLKEQGKIAVIAYHSLEDRIIKNYFREQAKAGHLQILNKKPITPAASEVSNNFRSRSAKLRIAIKL
ncbi:MAG: 16S rRNA (cytosine(1402)-N(4))-methyltransferase RsmH [Candidatus Parcubacteria bacterium]|nr:16S rRNA (cytosine(1402)-N(4))-methyltransferase RsmH [Candidatus Parcubacteria bacterium]